MKLVVALVIVLLLCRLAKSLHLGIKVRLSQENSISAPPRKESTCTYPEHERDQIEERDPELHRCSLASVIDAKIRTDLRREESLRKYERERGADPHYLRE